MILKVSGAPLSSLSLRQALDILRSSPPITTLQVSVVAAQEAQMMRVKTCKLMLSRRILEGYFYCIKDLEPVSYKGLAEMTSTMPLVNNQSIKINKRLVVVYYKI